MNTGNSSPTESAARKPGHDSSLCWTEHGPASESPLIKRLQSAMLDWWQGTLNCDLWLTLAFYDIMLRYRRSILGPLWITISMAALLTGMGPLYSTLLNIPRSTFFPHLTLGIIWWTFMSSTILEGAGCLISGARFIKQGNFPPIIIIWRNLAKNVLQLLHHAILIVPILMLFRIPLTVSSLAILPGLLLLLINLHFVTLWVAFASARFRDIPQMITSLMQLLMFLTPVFWIPTQISQDSPVLRYNPFSHLLTLVRDPLLGTLPPASAVHAALTITLVNGVFALTCYTLFYRRLSFWV